MVVRGMSKIGTKRAREWIFPDRLAANRRQTPASASGRRSVLTLVMCGFRHLQASTLGLGCRKNEPKKWNDRQTNESIVALFDRQRVKLVVGAQMDHYL